MAPARHRVWSLAYWRGLSLARQFLAGAAIVLLAGMAAIGAWVSVRISEAVTDHTAHAAALYMDGSIGPIVQTLATADRLTAAQIKQLDELLETPSVRERIATMKIWRTDAINVYSRWKDMIGQYYPPPTGFKSALTGHVAAELDRHDGEENFREHVAGLPMLEIYAPVRAKDSDRVIAVVEFYVDGNKLAADLRSAVIQSWLVVGGVTFLMLAGLSGIVARGSRTIDDQRAQLKTQVADLQGLLGQNGELRQRLQESSARIAEINERTLQKVGADLHDGPAQLLTYQLLRMNSLAPLVERTATPEEKEQLSRMRAAIAETLSEVRSISSGLSLPQLSQASLLSTVTMAVEQHEERTGTKVAVEVEGEQELPDVPLPMKICAYRVVQEALTNSFRHAGGRNQRVRIETGDQLAVSISDDGPGFDLAASKTTGLGLTGMQARVEALGGTLKIASAPETGTTLSAAFELRELNRKG